MKRAWMAWALRTLVLVALLLSGPSRAQQRGGTLKLYQGASPASMSVHEEAGYSASVSGMPVFNNLVMYKQNIPQNSVSTIVPDLVPNGRGMTRAQY